MTLLFSGDVQDRSKAEILHQNLPSWVKGHCLNHCSSQKLGVLRVRFQNHMSTLSKIWESVVPWNHLIPSADETTMSNAYMFLFWVTLNLTETPCIHLSHLVTLRNENEGLRGSWIKRTLKNLSKNFGPKKCCWKNPLFSLRYRFIIIIIHEWIQSPHSAMITNKIIWKITFLLESIQIAYF